MTIDLNDDDLTEILFLLNTAIYREKRYLEGDSDIRTLAENRIKHLDKLIERVRAALKEELHEDL